MSQRGINFGKAEGILLAQLGIASGEMDRFEELGGAEDRQYVEAQRRHAQIHMRIQRLSSASDAELQAIIDIVGPEVHAFARSNNG